MFNEEKCCIFDVGLSCVFGTTSDIRAEHQRSKSFVAKRKNNNDIFIACELVPSIYMNFYYMFNLCYV